MKPDDAIKIHIIDGEKLLTFSDYANKLKKQHDLTGGGGYPFEVVLGWTKEVKDHSPEQPILLRKYFKHVYDRKAKVEDLATEEWSFPLLVAIGRKGTTELTEQDVKIVEPSGRQMNIEEMFET